MPSPEDTRVSLEGVIERIVYENPDTAFFVGRLRRKGEPDLTTFVGNLMAVSVGETVRLHGYWVDDKKWGRQLRVERYDVVVPSTVDAIEKYLGSGLIDGIGKAFAKRLVEAFGVETLRVIEEEPARLRSVPGIGRKRASQIREAWQAQRAIRAIMLFLQGHGINVGQAARIYKTYGEKAVAVLRQNPYRLADEIVGIGFRGADRIAANLGIPRDAPQRLEAGLLYALDQAAGEGHCFLPEAELLSNAAELLEIKQEQIQESLIELVRRGDVLRDGDAIYARSLWTAEHGCDQLLKRLLRTPRGDVSIHAEKAIEWIERTQKIRLSEDQRDAVRAAATAKALVVTGGPGTGKTTVIKSLLSIFEKKGLKVMLAAPTGRAAKRMEAATGRPALTIHRLLEFSPKQGGFVRNENNPLRVDLLIIDETSMVDIHLMHNLLKALPPHARLFLVGDVDQLPSVGPGNVLMDVIASGTAPVVWLRKVFRQAEESGIVANAHRINRGEYPEFNDKDFFFIERRDPAKALETVVQLVGERIPQKFGLNPARDIQVLTPMRRGDAGVTRLNEALQQALNAQGQAVLKRAFRVGDKVMQTRNNYELDVFNGDVGVVTLVDEETNEVHVQYEDAVVLYSLAELDDLALAYAATVHKSQGSEYPAVVITLLPQHYLLLQRNVLYTAVTRAARIAVIVGDKKAIRMAIGNSKMAERHTRLAARLRNQL